MEYRKNELYHHGILGQKWGKRNGPPYPLGASDHSAAEKKAGWKKSLNKNSIEKESINSSKKYTFDKEKAKKVALASAAIAGAGVGIYFAYKHGAVESIASLLGNGASMDDCAEAMRDITDEMDFVIPKDTMLHRMNAYPDYEPGTDYTFASFTDPDVTAYMTLFENHEGTGESYDVALRAIKDLKVPSRQKALEVFNELWDNEPRFKEGVIDSIRKTYEDLIESGYYSQKQVENFIKRDLSEDPLRVMSYALVKRNDQVKKYVDQLRKAGYDAVIDYYDKGIMADKPLIVLDPKGSLEKFGEMYVTQDLKLSRLRSLQKQGFEYYSAGNQNVEEAIEAVKKSKRFSR